MRTFDQARTAPPLGSAVAACGLALTLGLAASWDARIGVAFALAVVLGLALILRPSLLLPALIGGMFVEIVSVGGFGVVTLLAPVAILVLLAAATLPQTQIRVGAPFAWAIAYALWALASGLWTVSLGGTTYLLASLAIALVYMLAFATLLTSEPELERVLYAFAFAALGIGLFAIAVFFLELSESIAVGGRSAGGTGDPNFFAAYQVVALPLMLALAARAAGAGRAQRALVYGAILVIIGSVLTSVSRGGLLALIAVTLIVFAVPTRLLFRSRRHKAAFVAAVVLGAGLSVGAAANEILPRIESVFSQRETAEGEGSGRLQLWAAAWMSVQERPVFGLGFGSFSRVSNELIVRTPGIAFQHFELRPSGTQVHSAYLGTLTELGVVGLALFLGLLISTALALRRTARRARRAERYFIMRVANALLLSLLGWSIASVFLSSETSRPLWIVIGLSFALPRLLESERIGGVPDAGAHAETPRDDIVDDKRAG